MLSDRFVYLSILVLTWPLRWLSYRSIHKIGAFLAQVFKLTIISINLIAFVLSYICLLMHQDRLNLNN